MMDRAQWSTLRRLVTDEIIFLDKGFGPDKPLKVQEEYEQLQSCLTYLDQEAERMSKREYENGHYQWHTHD